MTRGAALRQRRLECGLTQAQLAGRAGVSRQLVAAVESGRHAPAVDAALALAAALQTTVEALFASALPEAVPALQGRLRDRTPLRVGRVGDQLVAAELADHGISGAGWANPDAVADGGEIRLLREARPAGFVLAGCDPAFGLAERMLEGLGPRSLLAIPAPTGKALRALSDERVHAAVVHGVERQLPEAPVPVNRWHVARWQVGIGIPAGRPWRSLEDVLRSGAPVVQRDEAAASQQAFERARRTGGLPAAPGPLATGHLDGARLATTLGYACITIEAAAQAFGLRFLPIEEHVVELWTAQQWSDLPGLHALADLLTRGSFTERVAHYGGYDLSNCGQRIG